MDCRNLAIGGSAVVELLPRHPKIEGSSLVTITGTWRDNGETSGRHDIQHNDTLHNDTLHNDTLHNDT